ncbi:YgdI/YgdR family lipoprotein [Ferrimonas balearica]|uniref:YgdI/YgdR family lipoprotein n=1 Tax=Ferrimonas balearica TaxID=44012 RepID=UPI001C99E747|nr:YgdI/YgdR family lipoprotein [Ferrimonas balearica]MBY5993603.1 YgdI/YgdR family lipoprotein [Ferrimonas balearica]
MRPFLFLFFALFLTACGSTEYIMSTHDGRLIPTYGKPELDRETGMYRYEDKEGKEQMIRQDEVQEIIER